MSVKTELALLKAQSPKGILKPEAVVTWARTHKKSALHKRFTWDVKHAAHEYWLWQARQIISVHVTILDTGNGQAKGREYVAVRTESGKTGSEGGYDGFIATQDAFNNEDTRRRLVADQIRRILSVLESYPLPELRVVMTVVHGLAKKFIRDTKAPHNRRDTRTRRNGHTIRRRPNGKDGDNRISA